MTSVRKYWCAVAAANAAGAALVFIGANASTAIQLIGVLLLAPGSLVATLLPLQKLWFPLLWKCCQIDATGLSNLMYLPVATAANLLVWWGVRIWFLRRAKRRLASTGAKPPL